MEENLLVIGPITLAMKSRDILKKNGINTTLMRTPQGIGFKSCGYSLYVPHNIINAQSILNNNGISVIGRASVSRR